MRVLAEIGVGGVDGQRCVTLVKLVSHTVVRHRCYLPLYITAAGTAAGVRPAGDCAVAPRVAGAAVTMGIRPYAHCHGLVATRGASAHEEESPP